MSILASEVRACFRKRTKKEEQRKLSAELPVDHAKQSCICEAGQKELQIHIELVLSYQKLH
jgi:hypothetical protein